MSLNEQILSILACPKCQGDMVLVQEGRGLACKVCKLLYAVENDIPVLLVEKAKPYDEKDETLEAGA